MDVRLRWAGITAGGHLQGARVAGPAAPGAVIPPPAPPGRSRPPAIVIVFAALIAVGLVLGIAIRVGPFIEAERIKALETSTTGTVVDCDRASSGRRSFGGRYRAVWSYEVDGTQHTLRDVVNRMSSSDCTALLNRAAQAEIFYDPDDHDRAARGDLV
ncbi:hypothetical protein GCM10027515_29990 [Schumannella luteola]|uniref:DUF3592 domain-containing protein n=1 Tax=Schumannella luteola TaxID=472059 RepID=A0A852YD23_9MICO|nr:DUF3592 domain-containing protein [Schumannella luteola]NYG99200.1 hypothetical protein [Schumannella luteola]TPX02512.1 hypothetical protein FJ656_21915 [Schumannella luteola]